MTIFCNHCGNKFFTPRLFAEHKCERERNASLLRDSLHGAPARPMNNQINNELYKALGLIEGLSATIHTDSPLKKGLEKIEQILISHLGNN